VRGADKRVDLIAEDLVEHFTTRATLQCDSPWTNADAAMWWERHRPASEESEMRKGDQSA
jgi:hypothetical protein